MSAISSIEWTDATWNPTTGCTKISPGCAHCYIERTPAFRIAGNKFVNGKTDIAIFHDRLAQPLHWRKPRRVFVNSLSDLFHEDISDAFIDRVFAVMALCPQHTFQILTKRPQRMQAYVLQLQQRLGDLWDLTNQPTWITLPAGRSFPRYPENWPLPNVWLGVSVENQHFADERIPLLLQTPAAVRFISAEPLLGPVDLRRVKYHDDHAVDALFGEAWTTSDHVWLGHPFNSKLDWVIVGVEQLAGKHPGRNAAAYEQDARDLLHQCQAAGVAAFHKQMPIRGRVSGDPAEWPLDLRVREYPLPRGTSPPPVGLSETR